MSSAARTHHSCSRADQGCGAISVMSYSKPDEPPTVRSWMLDVFQRRLLLMRPALRANFQCCVIVDSSLPTVEARVMRSTAVIPRAEAVRAVAERVSTTFGLSAEADSRSRYCSKLNAGFAAHRADAAWALWRYQPEAQTAFRVTGRQCHGGGNGQSSRPALV